MTDEENRDYYCAQHAPNDTTALNQPSWPFWKCVVCGYVATHFVLCGEREKKAAA